MKYLNYLWVSILFFSVLGFGFVPLIVSASGSCDSTQCFTDSLSTVSLYDSALVLIGSSESSGQALKLGDTVAKGGLPRVNYEGFPGTFWWYIKDGSSTAYIYFSTEDIWYSFSGDYGAYSVVQIDDPNGESGGLWSVDNSVDVIEQSLYDVGFILLLVVSAVVVALIALQGLGFAIRHIKKYITGKKF